MISEIKTAVNNVKEMYYFNVTVDYQYYHNLEQTKSYEEVRHNIMTEMKSRVGIFSKVVFWTNNLLMLMFVWLFVK